ncbi:MAG TPA: hypothetical protein VGF89_05145 [Steroidobacteraceae bacterium]
MANTRHRSCDYYPLAFQWGWSLVSVGAGVEFAGAVVPESGVLGAEICGVSTDGAAGVDEAASFGGGGVESLDFELSELSDLFELLCLDDLEFDSPAVATRLRPEDAFDGLADWVALSSVAVVLGLGVIAAAAGASGGLAAGALGAAALGAIASGTVAAGAATAGTGAVLRASSLSCLARTANTDTPIPNTTARPAPITILLVACEFIIWGSPFNGWTLGIVLSCPLARTHKPNRKLSFPQTYVADAGKQVCY